MELGNLIFGNSRGEYPFPDRNIVNSKEWKELCKRANVDIVYGYSLEYNNDFNGFDNEVFTIRPYYWGECTCGFEEKEEEWLQNHKHKDYCYQSLVEKELIEKGWQYDKYNFFLSPPKNLLDEALEIKDNIRKKYCKMLGLPYTGRAAHCTCDYKEEYNKWREENDHSEQCLLVLPNFHYKPTNFKIEWYKYAFRDSYMNQNLTKEEILEIFAKCAESI